MRSWIHRPVKRTCLITAALFFLVLLAADSVLLFMAYQDYDDKVKLLSGMVYQTEPGGEEENRALLKQAADLLRGKAVDYEKGKELLKEYGYFNGYDDVFGRALKARIKWTLTVSIMLYLGFLLALRVLYRKWNQEKESELSLIESFLTDFREGRYKTALGENRSSDRDSLSRIYSLADSLGECLALKEEQLNYEKDEVKSLVTDISHQLKTPVAALRTCLGVLAREDLKQEEREEFLRRCNDQLEGLHNLLAALLNISRMETGMIQLKIEESSIMDTLISAVNRIYQRAEEKQIEMGLESGDDLENLKIPQDSGWLCEAIVNILDNAIKYSPARTCITIQISRGISFLRIEIADQGIGIPAEDYHRIFKRFYRGSSVEVKNQPGSGVGLYLTREIITRHKGTVAAVSGAPKTGAGSRFVIQLPLGSE